MLLRRMRICQCYLAILLLCICCCIVAPLELKKTLTKSTDVDSDNCNTTKLCEAISSSMSCHKDDNSSLSNWGGVNITVQELCNVRLLRSQLYASPISLDSVWLREVTDVELLRFLRAKHGHVDDALKMIEAHVAWRSSQYGADSDLIKTAFVNSPLRHEIFWLGLNKENCPTLVIRTQVHDGVYYDEDPKIFVSFVVSMLEEGKQLYGVGSDKQLCLLLDRGGTIKRNGSRKVEKMDMAVIPNLIELFRHLKSVLLDNYPELLRYAHIAPASWFFSMCYKITSRVMDAKIRARFHMLKDRDVASRLHAVIDPVYLPEHLGGSSAIYRSEVDIMYEQPIT